MRATLLLDAFARVDRRVARQWSGGRGDGRAQRKGTERSPVEDRQDRQHLD